MQESCVFNHGQTIHNSKQTQKDLQVKVDTYPIPPIIKLYTVQYTYDDLQLMG